MVNVLSSRVSLNGRHPEMNINLIYTKVNISDKLRK